jgi:hypothetical protein
MVKAERWAGREVLGASVPVVLHTTQDSLDCQAVLQLALASFRAAKDLGRFGRTASQQTLLAMRFWRLPIPDQPILLKLLPYHFRGQV